jgi:tRNA-dihydrouridine synthase C
MKTWITKGTPALILAPMEGVTDAPMRTILTENGSFTHAVSEFLRISEGILPERIYLEYSPELKNQSRTPHGTPVIFQLLGGNPEKLAKSAQVAVNLGAVGIDLNFGCPAPTVNRHDGGATLLKFPDRIFSIIQAVRQSVPQHISVSAKFRLGWDTQDPIYENAEKATLAGANWITIHGRTKVDGYKPPAYWGPIGKLQRTLPIPVVANGDIWTLQDFKRCRDETGCEHYMLGRGAVANPHLSTQVALELGIIKETVLSSTPDSEQWKFYFNRLISLGLAHSFHEGYVLGRIKQWTKAAHNRVPGHLYDKIKTIKTLQELNSVIHAL